MAAQNGPSEKTKELIDSLGGSIWSTVTDMAAGGVATARTAIDTAFQVPDAARALLGWRPIEAPTDQAVSESLIAVFDIAGGNYKFQPQEVIGGNTSGSILTDAGGMNVAPSEYYDVFAPVSGGETWNVGVEPLDAIAGNRRSGVEFTWSDVRPPLPVIYSNCSRETAITAATTGDIAGTTLNIANTHKLIEVGGVYTDELPTIEEEGNTTLVLKCTVWSPVQELRVMMEPIVAPANLAADEGCETVHLTRRVQRLKFTKENAIVTAAFDVDVAHTAAGQAAYYLRWI